MKIKDVIHGEIEIDDEIIVDLIYTKEFQRLRKIKQLGVTNFNFPGAEHNRYSHSLGVYQITSEIIKKFQKERVSFFNDFEALALKIAALLHDLGHGALSHTFESFFGTEHEEYTIKIIEHKSGSIYKILKKYEEKNGYDLLKDIVAFINKKHSSKALVSIISSAIDADRMDYLLRDSYYSGVVYGNIDIQRVISYMTYKDGEIVFSEKGIHTLEDLILARYHMFVQVYLNDKSLIYEELIQKILTRIFYLNDNGFEFKNNIELLTRLKSQNIKVEDYVAVNDFNFLELISTLGNEDDEYLQRLCFYLDTKKPFYELITKKEFEDANLNDVFKTVSVNKKVYYKKEIIKVLKKSGKVVNIEDVSQIFDFCQNKLTIKVDEKYYRIKKENEI